MGRVRTTILAALVFVACNSEPSPSEEPVSTACETSALTYENFAGPFFLDWCTGCHSSSLPAGDRQDAPLGVDFDSIEGIRAHQSRIAVRVLEERSMPPAGGPSEEERRLIVEWLSCGLSDAKEGFSPSPPPDSGPSPDDLLERACAAPRTPLPADVLPRCAPETLVCVQNCATSAADGGSTDDDAIETCRDACLAADPTPPSSDPEYPGDCSDCTFSQLLACGEAYGCHDQVAGLMCCIDECLVGAIIDCKNHCASEIEAFGYCVYFTGEECLSYDGEYLGACF